jgi:hypothetical protein
MLAGAALACAAAGAAPPAATGEDPFDAPVLDVRPRIFLRADRFDGLTVAKLRQAAAQPEFAVIRRKWPAKPLGRALEWMITGRREDLDAAIAGLRTMDAASGTWSDRGLALVELAALYDWLYAELDEPARREAAARIERAADAAVAHCRAGQAPFFYSRTPGALAGATVSGLALAGVSPKADGYLALLRQWGVSDYFKACAWADGAATGATYTFYYTYVDLAHICAAWWSATGRNPTAWIRANQGDWLDRIVVHCLWYLRPGFAFTDINDQSRDLWGTYDQFCQGLDIASYVTRNGHGRAWSKRWLGRFGPTLYHTEYAHNFIFRDLALQPKPLTDLPHAELFGRDSCGYGFFRSAWPADGRPDTATHVFFRMGDPMNVHGGVAAGEFQVFRYAPLAARGGRYGPYDSPQDQYHRGAVSTSTVLFTDPSVPDDRGDQNTRRGLKTDHKTWADWLAIRQRSGLDVAAITHWDPAPGRARCRADLTRTNPPTKCRHWTREFVWLADRHLVVLDVAEAASPAIRCQWQLHAGARPQVGDRLLTVVNRAPDARWADASLQPKHAEGRLFCRLLAPHDYRLVLHTGGKAEAFDAAGRSQGQVEGNPYHLRYGGHVVQVEAAGAAGRTVFLAALAATDSAETTPPKVSMRLVRPGQVEVNADGATVRLDVPDWFGRSER